MTREEAIEELRKKTEECTGCHNCPYNAHGYIAKSWKDRADHVVGPCGQQNCWLDLDKKVK